MGRRAAHRWILDVGAMAAAARVNLVRGGRVGQAGVNRPKGNEGDLAGITVLSGCVCGPEVCAA